MDYLEIDNNVSVFVVSHGAGVERTTRHEHKLTTQIFLYKLKQTKLVNLLPKFSHNGQQSLLHKIIRNCPKS